MHYVFPWEKSSADYQKEYARINGTGALSTPEAVRIAVLGSSTLNFFSQVLAVRLFESGVAAAVWTAPYGQVQRQTTDPAAELAGFKPHFTLVVQEVSDALGAGYEKELQRPENHGELKRKAIDYCKALAENLSRNCPRVLISNFTTPATTPFGTAEGRRKGERRFVQELNHALADEFASNPAVVVVDLDCACANAGKIDAASEKYRFLGDFRLSHKQGVMLADEVAGVVAALLGRARKCIVLDLDNTLWGGVIGEDGLGGIKLGQGDPVGKAFHEFQKELLKLHKRGVILAVNSRNNLEDALEAIRNHPEMVLREDHFAAVRANWLDKATNLEALAKEINISLDSMVFIDDDAFNVALVRERLPQVASILLPKDASAYPLLLKTLRLFDTTNVTEEDLHRGGMYAEDRKRRESEGSFASCEDFLASLELEMTVGTADSFTIPRISQLTMRTNQFNMTTKRYGEDDVARMASSAEWRAYWMSVKDRFGDYGIVGACITRIEGTTAVVDSFLMSCRVLGKGIENSFLWKVLELEKARGAKRVRAQALPTQKNSAFLDFYAKAGLRNENENGYAMDLAGAQLNFPKHITWGEKSL